MLSLVESWDTIMCVDCVCVGGGGGGGVMGGEEEEEEEEEEARVTRALLHFSRMLDKAAKNRFHLIAKKLIPTPTTTQSRAEQSSDGLLQT